jgi:hypothetical protein
MTDNEITTHAKAEINRRIGEMKLESLVFFARAKLCGRLNVMPNALDAMGIPRIDLTGNGSTIRYSLKTVLAYLDKKEGAA